MTFGALAAVALAACGRNAPSGGGAAGAAAGAPKTVMDYFPIKVGDQVVRMQFAVRPAEMQRGLMGRRDLVATQRARVFKALLFFGSIVI